MCCTVLAPVFQCPIVTQLSSKFFPWNFITVSAAAASQTLQFQPSQASRQDKHQRAGANDSIQLTLAEQLADKLVALVGLVSQSIRRHSFVNNNQIYKVPIQAFDKSLSQFHPLNCLREHITIKNNKIKIRLTIPLPQKMTEKTVVQTLVLVDSRQQQKTEKIRGTKVEKKQLSNYGKCPHRNSHTHTQKAHHQWLDF